MIKKKYIYVNKIHLGLNRHPNVQKIMLQYLISPHNGPKLLETHFPSLPLNTGEPQTSLTSYTNIMVMDNLDFSLG